MKKKFYSFINILIFFLLNLETIQASTVEKILGIYLSDMTYEEPKYMSENGSMVGILGSYGIYNDYMIKFEGNYAEGLMDYVGSGAMESYDHIIELRELVGINYTLKNKENIIPFIGLGYRYLNDDSTNTITTSGAEGYEREQSYLYSPIGFEYRLNLPKYGLYLGSNIEYDLFWQGTNHSHTSTVPGYYDITFNQYKGHGFRISFHFIKIESKHNYFIEPFYKYWHIDDSDLTIDPSGRVFFEPKNTSTEIGIQSKWLF